MKSGLLTKIDMVSDILSRFDFDSASPVSAFGDKFPVMERQMIQSAQEMMNDIYEQIIRLRIILDNKHGIYSFITDNVHHQRTWIRYVDMVIAEPAPWLERHINAVNYLRMFYSYLLAAIVSCQVYHMDEPACLQSIMNVKKIITESFMDSIVTADEVSLLRILSEGKGMLVNIISAFSRELDSSLIGSVLDQIKDWVALMQTSMRVVTIIKTEKDLHDARIAILDEPCCELTQDQRRLFEDLEDQKWFKNLSELEKKLVIYYKDAIVSGKCVIPSQLRAVIPLCKNTYQQTVLVQRGESEPEILNSYYHSSTVAYLGRNDDTIAQTVTGLNMCQQRQLCQADAMVMICLNSEWGDKWLQTYEWLNKRNYAADDSRSIKLTEMASRKLSADKIFYAKMCLNYFRLVEYNSYSGINNLIDIIKANAGKLKKDDKDVACMLELVLKIEHLQGQFTPLDLNAKGLDIIHLLTQAATLNNQLVLKYPDLSLQSVAVWFGCASGENRTGITYYHTLSKSLHDYFARSQVRLNDESLQSRIFRMIAVSQHVLLMTGNQGSTFGTEGIRSKSSGTFRASHDASHLLTKCSDIKVIPAEDCNYNQSLDRLCECLSDVEKDTRFKSVITMISQFADHAREQRMVYLSLSQAERFLYNEFIVQLRQFLSYSSGTTALNQLESLLQTLSGESSAKTLAGQLPLLTKIYSQVRLIHQSVQSSQLTQLSVFGHGNVSDSQVGHAVTDDVNNFQRK